MSKKTATIYARIEPQVKEEAENILDNVGLSASDAINVFYHQVIYQGGLPFEVKIDKNAPPHLNSDNWDKEKLLAEIDKGIGSLEAGNGRPAKEFFAEMREKYGI